MTFEKDFDGLIDTFEECKNRLQTLENIIFEKYNILTREELIIKLQNNIIIEDELISKWHCEYSNYMEWLRHEC